jgi:hypothetical protein
MDIHIIAMGKVQRLAAEMLYPRRSDYPHATLTLQVVVAPHIVVTGVKDNLYTAIRKLRQTPQNTHKALWHNPAILKPKVKDIAKEVEVCNILGDGIQPPAKGTLDTLLLMLIPSPEMYVRHKVNHAIGNALSRAREPRCVVVHW